MKSSIFRTHRVVSDHTHHVQVLLRLSVHGQLKGLLEIQPDVLSAIQAQKSVAAHVIRGHQFNPVVARKSEQCKACHWGKDHRDWEAYDISIHGVVWQTGKWDPTQFDLTKKLSEADYVGPTCQYCHLRGGHHNVQRLSTVYTSMGMSNADRGAPLWKEKRDTWVSVCDDCHSPRFARENLQAMDEACKDAGLKYTETFKVAENLQLDGMGEPMPKDLHPDWAGEHVWSLKIGAYHDGPGYGVRRVSPVSSGCPTVQT
jgi:hydroxylamine dehydrogenase